MKKKIGILGLLIVIDQVIKVIIVNSNPDFSIITNFLSIVYVKNFGVAWSMLNNKQFLIIIFSIVAIGYLIKLLQEYKDYPLIGVGLTMMIAGAIGNFLDRFIRGFVVDYIDVYIFGYDFPVFNFADSMLVIGVAIIFIDVLRKVKNGEEI